MKILSCDGVVNMNGQMVMQPKTRYVVPNEMGWFFTNKITGPKWSVSNVDCFERRYAGQDLNHKSLCMVRFQGIGDLLMVSALPRYLKKLYPDAKIHAYANSSYSAAAWLGHPDLDVQSAIPLPITLDAVKQYDYHLFFDGMIESNTEYDQGNAYDDMFAYAGLHNVPDEFKVPVIKMHDSDEKWMNDNAIDTSERYFVYCAHASAPQRTYPWVQSKQVIESLLEDYPDAKVYVLSEQDLPRPESDRCVWVGAMDNWRWVIPLIKNCNCLITPDSGFGHVAACFPDVPVVSMWGAFTYESRALYYTNHHPLRAYDACASAPCWQHGGELPKAKCETCSAFQGDEGHCAALSTITPEAVVAEVKRYAR